MTTWYLQLGREQEDVPTGAPTPVDVVGSDEEMATAQNGLHHEARAAVLRWSGSNGSDHYVAISRRITF